ncbi:MAG: TenA family protein [Rhodospirillales bacterium]|nr:TenA family protein [Rhodospirillales bacterium]
MSAAPPAEDLFSHLLAACDDDWAAYVRHPFVRALADGSLPQACFRRYLVQDYLFLVHFARAYGLAAFKAETLGDIRAAAAGLTAIVDRELDLHVAYCEGWGMGADQLGAAEEADATVAYTRFVLEKGLSGDLLDLQVALAPCVVGYGEIGRALADDPATLRNENPYESWIEMYGGADYQAVADAHVDRMSEIFARRGGPARLSGLVATFRQATRLERAFWDMAFATAAAPLA